MLKKILLGIFFITTLFLVAYNVSPQVRDTVLPFFKNVPYVQTYDYTYCKDGSYSKYPHGVLDADAVYYTKGGVEITACGFYRPENQIQCKKLREGC